MLTMAKDWKSVLLSDDHLRKALPPLLKKVIYVCKELTKSKVDESIASRYLVDPNERCTNFEDK